jgi:hypothetical protein
MHGTETANKRRLELKKAKDEKNNVVTDRQRDTMIKAKKDCHFEYLLSYKAVNKGSKKKQYIRTLKCLAYTYFIHLNPFSFTVYEKGTSERDVSGGLI